MTGSHFSFECLCQQLAQAAAVHAPVIEPEERPMTRKESKAEWLARSAALIAEGRKRHE